MKPKPPHPILDQADREAASSRPSLPLEWHKEFAEEEEERLTIPVPEDPEMRKRLFELVLGRKPDPEEDR